MTPYAAGDTARLHATLDAFRAAHGFGRAIAAPQLGIDRRLIALRIPGGPDRMIDPVLRWCSPETVTLWDDCLSFPELYVRVRRHARVVVESTGPGGRRDTWEIEDPHLAELVQHEIDHLDGILAVDRVTDGGGLVHRADFLADPQAHAARVDLAPRPVALQRGSGELA